jgi:hypothetical protein
VIAELSGYHPVRKSSPAFVTIAALACAASASDSARAIAHATRILRIGLHSIGSPSMSSLSNQNDTSECVPAQSNTYWHNRTRPGAIRTYSRAPPVHDPRARRCRPVTVGPAATAAGLARSGGEA